MPTIISSHFRSLTPSQRRAHLQQYTNLILQEEGRRPPAMNHRPGKLFHYRPHMPWMLPAWRRGLAILTQVMADLGELPPSTGGPMCPPNAIATKKTDAPGHP